MAATGPPRPQRQARPTSGTPAGNGIPAWAEPLRQGQRYRDHRRDLANRGGRLHQATKRGITLPSIPKIGRIAQRPVVASAMATIIGASIAGTGKFSPPSRNQGRTPPIAASNRFTCQQRTGERKQGHNQTVILARPRNRTFTKPNCRLTTRKGRSTMARTAETFRPKAFGSPLSNPPAGFLVGAKIELSPSFSKYGMVRFAFQ